VGIKRGFREERTNQYEVIETMSFENKGPIVKRNVQTVTHFIEFSTASAECRNKNQKNDLQIIFIAINLIL